MAGNPLSLPCDSNSTASDGTGKPGRHLLARTGQPCLDQMLGEIIASFEAIFPGRIRAWYLAGGWRVGNFLPASKVELRAVFKGSFLSGEQAKFRTHEKMLRAGGSILAQLKSTDEMGLLIREGFELRFASFGSLHLCGDDIRSIIPMPPLDQYTWTICSWAFHALLEAHGGSESLAVPLIQPAPEAELYGRDPCSHLDIVLSTGLVAAGRIALAAGCAVPSLEDVPQIYRQTIDDRWEGVVVEVFNSCRFANQGQIPDDSYARLAFRRICRQVLAFENVFIDDYLAYLMRETASGVRSREARARARLMQFQFGRDPCPNNSAV